MSETNQEINMGMNDGQSDRTTTIPRVDKQIRKKTAVQKLSQDLLEATRMPDKEDAIKKLDSDLSIPTRGVFYDYGTLLDKSKLKDYPEFQHLRPGVDVPDEIGEFKLDPVYNFLNERYYIVPILHRASEAGFEIAKVTEKGIFFFLREEDLAENSLKLYRRFFLSEIEVLNKVREVIQHLVDQNGGHQLTDIYRIRIRGDYFNHIRMTYPDVFSRAQLARLRYELRVHYNRMNFWIKFFHDRKLENIKVNEAEQPEPTVLKIHFDLKDILPRIRKLQDKAEADTEVVQEAEAEPEDNGSSD